MTRETRTFIKTGDITGIEIECPKCHLTVVYPVNVKEIIKIGPNCTHCNHTLFDSTHNSVYPETHFPAIDAIQDIAANVRKLTRPDRTDIHANVRLCINTEPEAIA